MSISSQPRREPGSRSWRSENASDQLTIAAAISASRAASSPITTVQTKHIGGQLQRIPRHNREANKKRIQWLDVPPARSDVDGQLYGSGRSLKRVRRIEAAVA